MMEDSNFLEVWKGGICSGGGGGIYNCSYSCKGWTNNYTAIEYMNSTIL